MPQDLPQDPLVSQAVPAYLRLRVEDGLAHNSLVKTEYECRLGLMAFLADLHMSEVSPAVAQQSLDRRAESGPAAALGMRTIASQLWRRLLAEGAYLGPNPWPHTRKPITEDRRFPITAHHAKAIDELCSEIFWERRPGVVTEIYGGLFAWWIRVPVRRAETQLVFEQLDFETGEIYYDRHSHKTGRKVGAKYVDGSAGIRLIHEVRKRAYHPRIVWPSARSKSGFIVDPMKAWKRVLERVGAPSHYRLHDIRHGFAAAAHEAGQDLKSIGGALCHRSINTTSRYVGVASRRRIRSAMEAGVKGLLGEAAGAARPAPPSTAREDHASQSGSKRRLNKANK